jgi:hypothetical protein
MWCPHIPFKCEKLPCTAYSNEPSCSFEIAAIAGSLLSIRSVFAKYDVSVYQHCGKSAIAM